MSKRKIPFAFFLLALASALNSQTLPADLQTLLAQQFSFSPSDLSKLEAGQPVARLLKSASPDDLQLIGAVLVNVDSATFIRGYKEIARFESGKEVRHTGKFSDPAAVADLKDFHWPDLNREAIEACKPGKCDYKIPAEVMQKLKVGPNVSTPEEKAQVDALIRQLWVDYLNRYRAHGDAALAVYYDTPTPFSVAGGLKNLIGNLQVAREHMPDLVRYVQDFPHNKPPNTEEFLYWQEAAFGLKPVIRASHVIIQELPREGGSHYAIASKMLFASHYFRAGIEFKYVYPVRSSAGKPAVFFLTYSRSYVDGMTGLTGSLLRKIAPGRSQSTLIDDLQLAKLAFERGELP